jgi:hypothetical protein
MVSPEIEAQILRLHHVEKWPVGTIAHQLSIHHSVVDRVLTEAGIPKAALARPSWRTRTCRSSSRRSRSTRR